MPITKSAKKALLVSMRRKKENLVTKSKLKGAIKSARVAKAGKKLTPELVQAFYRQLDTAVKKKYIHKNKASRLKSRICQGYREDSVGKLPPKVKTTIKKPAKKANLKSKPVQK